MMRLTVTCTQCDKGAVVDIAYDGAISYVRGNRVTLHTGWIQGGRKLQAHALRCGRCRSAIINVWPVDSWEPPNTPDAA